MDNCQKCNRPLVEPSDIELVCQGCEMLPEDCECEEGVECKNCGSGLIKNGVCQMCAAKQNTSKTIVEDSKQP